MKNDRLAAVVAAGLMWVLPGGLLVTLGALTVGGLAALPFVWAEVKGLVRL